MMITCNGHRLSNFWYHILVNRMQLGKCSCVALAAVVFTYSMFRHLGDRLIIDLLTFVFKQKV